MNKEQKRQFVAELMDSVKESVFKLIDKMPDEWTGLELRVVLFIMFAEQILGSNRARIKRKVREWFNVN